MLHVHTNRSDGSGSPEEIAEAAARAGLGFVVLTDHGDGTRRPNPPRYVSGVLVIDAVELSTEDGHYIALGLPQAPYPLRGEARDVIEDVRRLGGFGIAAHPDSAKPSLQWRDWSARIDAIEWLNADTEWRDEGYPQLARAFVQYPFRPVETLGSLLDRPDRTFARWDSLTQRHRVVALAGADAHARAGWKDDDVNGYRRGWFLRFPSYDISFRAFSTRVVLASQFLPRGRIEKTAAEPDATAILEGLRTGRAYSVIDALADPGRFDFLYDHGEFSAYMGEVGQPSPGGTFTATTNAEWEGAIRLIKDGAVIAEGPLPELKSAVWKGEGTYRVEITLSGASGRPGVPWIVSNPIYMRARGWEQTPPIAQPTANITRGIQGGPWHVEKDEGSTAIVAQPDYPTGPVTFTYGLAAGERSGQYAALGISVGRAFSGADRIAFQAHASRRMRVSVQARHPQTGGRWQRSIYVDTTSREVVVPLNEFRAIGSSGAFDPSSTDTLLFVVDTVNTLPGTSGTVTIANLRVGRS